MDGFEDQAVMVQGDLEQGVMDMTHDKELETLPSHLILRMITFGQYLTDRCLNEIEKRGELEFIDGDPVLPYVSDHMIETVLTREGIEPPKAA